MNRVLPAFVFSVASLVAVGARAGTFDGTGYASVTGPQGGFEYVRLFPGDVVLSQMDHGLLTGAFANGDYATEYAIDDTYTLVRIDTAIGLVTPVGALAGISDASHVSLAIAPDTGLAFALVAQSPCTSSVLYAVDLVTGATTLIGAADGCMQSMVYAPDGTVYALDRGNDNLAMLYPDATDIGSIGFPLDDSDTLAFAPGSSSLWLFSFNPDIGTNALYAVDVSTGTTTLIGLMGTSTPITAVVLGGPLPDAIFAGGFDG